MSDTIPVRLVLEELSHAQRTGLHLALTLGYGDDDLRRRVPALFTENGGTQMHELTRAALRSILGVTP